MALAEEKQSELSITIERNSSFCNDIKQYVIF